MGTNNLELEINAPIPEVWLALTDSVAFSKWMTNVVVETDWMQGSEIKYTCYDGDGNVSQWDGMDMIWHGRIKTIKEHREFTCVYPNKSMGLIEESYLLEKSDDHKTRLIQLQTCTNQEVADGYKDGTSQSLGLLKTHLEKRDA